MGTPYTLGDWMVHEGRELDFVDAWREFATWTLTVVDGPGWAKLLRDADEPRRFISFGPWADEAAIAGWRGDPGFHSRVARIQPLVEVFTPHTMEVAAEAGPPTPDP